MKRTIIAAGVLALAAGLFSMGTAQAQCQDVTVGDICAAGDPTTATGEVYADGKADNPDPIDGYLGVNDDEGVVGCANGSYDHDRATDNNASDNNSVITPIPPDPGNPPSGETGPCTPTGP